MGFFKIAYVTTLAIAIGACQPPVVFGEPQPVDTPALSTIPDSYRGAYWCTVDSASLFVDDKAFIKRKELLVRLTHEEIEADSDLELQNGKLYVNSWGQSFPLEKKGDTIISTITLRDTIFVIRQEQILKPFKGHLILNTKLDENAWSVLVVSHKGKGLLSIARADLPENLSALDSIVPVKTLAKSSDKETQILIKPTKEQFEKILQQRLLFDGTCTDFERILPLRIDSY